jgi:hypothetical protein
MNYPDTQNSANGYITGVSVGKRLADALSPNDDGLDYLRNNTVHIGTMTADALSEDEDNGESEGNDNDEDNSPE